MRPRGSLSVWLVVLGCTCPLSAQEPSTSPLVVPSGTERVEVDLVVRDKDGKLVRDLTPGDVQVREDGVPQQTESLELVDRPTAPDGTASPAFLALVFDRLGPSSRRFARGAALELLAHELAPGTAVGVFSIDRRLAVLQSFTDDREALRRAVDATSSLAPTTLAGERERELTRNAYHGLGEGFGQAHVAPAEQKGAPECRGREEVRIRLTELLESRLVEGFESLERDQRGFGTAHALLALVGGLEALPGRKAVVLFSEGLAVPSDVEATYRSVVAAANRARVSIYTADTEGLRVASPADEMRRTADALRTRLRSSSDGGRLTEDSPLALLERNEDTLRVSPEGSLGRLAEETGGFSIRGTNDLSAGLAQVEEELRSHYILFYAPRNRDFDGRFRTIAVKVRRPHARLQARRGYLALKTALPVPALPYEAPALAALESGKSPADVPLHLRGLQFPEEPTSSRVAVAVEVPTRRDLAIVLLVRDASRRVVRKLSQRYELPGLEPRADGSVFFYREVRLPPGDYTIEAAAWDFKARKAGVAAQALAVRSADPGRLRASSLVVVSGAEKRETGEGEQPPELQLQGVLLHPNLGQPVKREAGRPLAFFLRAWPAAERAAVEARVEVVRGTRTVAAAPPLRLGPMADGRVQLVSSFPVDSLVAGAYELRVTLTDGRDEETRTAALSVGP